MIMKDNTNDYRIVPPSRHDADTIKEWLLKHSNLSTDQLAIRSGLKPETIFKWKLMYDVIDIRDKKLFSAWYKLYKYTYREIAFFLGLAPRIVLYYLDKYKLRNKTKAVYRHGAKPVPKLDKALLKDREFIKRLYAQGYSRDLLSRMFGINTSYAHQLVAGFCSDLLEEKKRREEQRVHKNKEWLIEHYVRKRWSMRKCAKVAGVHTTTISNWLTKYGLPIRIKKYKV